MPTDPKHMEEARATEAEILQTIDDCRNRLLKWSGSAFLAGEETPGTSDDENKTYLYSELCSLANTMAWLHHEVRTLSTGERDGWLPIESAPKDETGIIYRTKYGTIGFCHYSFAINDDEVDCWWDREADDEVVPRHWLPLSFLPAAPSALAQEDDR